MNMQIREIAKTADLKVAYGKDGLDVRVCVMNIEFHIALHTENVHISVDKIGGVHKYVAKC